MIRSFSRLVTPLKTPAGVCGGDGTQGLADPVVLLGSQGQDAEFAQRPRGGQRRTVPARRRARCSPMSCNAGQHSSRCGRRALVRLRDPVCQVVVASRAKQHPEPSTRARGLGACRSCDPFGASRPRRHGLQQACPGFAGREFDHRLPGGEHFEHSDLGLVQPGDVAPASTSAGGSRHTGRPVPRQDLGRVPG